MKKLILLMFFTNLLFCQGGRKDKIDTIKGGESIQSVVEEGLTQPQSKQKFEYEIISKNHTNHKNKSKLIYNLITMSCMYS